MLILTRRLGEKIYIGDNKQITITILSWKCGNIKVGIEADKAIPIFREEIFNRRQLLREKANANNQ